MADMTGSLVKNETIKSIQILRALAALGVVYYHCTASRGGYSFPQTGTFGVDIFFIISGFIIAHIVTKNTGRFLLKRIIRIVPLYTIATVMMGISAFVFKDAVYSTTVTVPGLIKSLLFIPYKMESRNGPVLEVGWTLQFEMFFYGATGICIILAGNKKRAALICGITVSAFYIILQIINSKVWLLNYYQKGLFPEFIYGLLLYRLYTRVPEKPKTPVKFIILHIMIGLFSLMYLIYSDIGGFRISNNRNIYYGIPSLLLAGSIVLLEKSIKNNRFINFCVALGEASYAMYLFHPFIILFLSRILFPKIIGENGSFIINLIKIITALGAAIGGSMLIYKIIDKPIQSCARSRLLNRIETRSNTN